MKTSTYGSFLSFAVIGGALMLEPSPQVEAPSRTKHPGATVPAGAADYIGLDGDAEPLRGSFNADMGKVRILMLVAPT